MSFGLVPTIRCFSPVAELLGEHMHASNRVEFGCGFYAGEKRLAHRLNLLNALVRSGKLCVQSIVARHVGM